MADLLPGFTQNVITTDAPQSKLTTADIRQPYESLARGLDKVGEGLMDVAEPMAERAGAEAVTRDGDGNIQIEKNPFIVGRAGDAYKRAVKIGALAESESSFQQADIQLRQQFKDDPQGYLAAAGSYKRKQVSDLSKADPMLGRAAGQSIEQISLQTYKGLLNEKERTDFARADSAITAQITSANDDAVALARQGIAPDAPEMRSILSKYSTLLDEKVSNPKFSYSKEQRDLDYQSFEGQLAGARNLYHVDQVYKTQGYQAATEAAKDVLTNPGYKLTPAQREAFHSRAMGEIRANEAIRTQDVNEARTAFRELSTAATLGAKIAPEEVDAVRQAFKAANYPAGVAMVDAAFAHKDLHDDFGRLPLGQQTQELNSIKGAAAAKAAYQFFTGKGYRPEEAAGIVGNLIHESGMNPTLPGDNGTSAGLAQFHNERLTALKQFAASRGKPATDFQTQLEFIDQELKTSEAPTLAALRLAKTPEEAAGAFIGYERPAGWTAQNPAGGLGYKNRQSLARSVFTGTAADGSGGPGVASWLVANRSAAVDDAATRAWKAVMDDWSAGKGGPPSDARISEITDAARASGNVDLLAKIARDTEVIDKVQRITQLPLAQQNAVELELRRRQAEGSTNPGAELIEKQLTAKTQAIQKGLDDNPIGTAVANFPDKFKTPAPLDIGNPDALAAGLKMRGQIAQIAAANWQTGPLSVLDSADVAQIKGALSGSDPAVKARVYGAIATLPDGVRDATLKKIAGNDPNSTAEAGAGSLIARDPDMASSIFRGFSAMKADPRFEPAKADGGKDAYQGDIDKALPSTTFSLAGRTNPSGDYATMTAMVKARYADLAAQSGDMKYSADRLSKAVTDVTGGVLSHNGGSLIAPRRGMTQPQFDGIMLGIADADLAGVTTLSGQPVSPQYLRSSAQLESVGEGRYLVRLGSDPLKPIYAMRNANTESPTPFVLDLRGRTPAEPAMIRAPENPF